MEAEKAIREYEDVVFRGKMPRKKVRKVRKIEVEYDERYHADTELGLHRDLADGVLKLATDCEVPF